jgi:hypothetical protein
LFGPTSTICIAPGSVGESRQSPFAARGFDVLLEEGLAVGEGAHQRAAEAAPHLAFQVEGRFHHHHRVGFAIDGLALTHRHMQEGIDIPGHGKSWHLASFEMRPLRSGRDREPVN